MLGPLNQPLATIITVVLNGRRSIESTLSSVTSKKTDLIEYVVIDGGSVDGTIEIIKKYSANIDYWVSEPDQGIYDAINKGIRAATGHFVYVLNLGDTLEYLPLSELITAKGQHADVVLFDVQLSDGRVFKSKVGFSLRYRNTIHHQGAFYRRSLGFQYDLNYRVFSDLDLNQKLFKSQKEFIKFDRLVCYHSLTGVSNHKKSLKEFYRLIRTNSGLLYVCLAFFYFKIFGVRKKISGLVRFDKPYLLRNEHLKV